MTPSPRPTTPSSPSSEAALTRFLTQRGLCTPPFTLRPIGDGHSNLTYLADGADRVVVRRPPPPPTPPGAHDMLREARFVAALRGTPVPVADVLATADAGEVIDVPFSVLSFAEGPVVTTKTPPPLDDPAARRRTGEALVDVLADLHAVDWRAAGLGDLGRPDGSNARRLRRTAQLATGAGPEFTRVERWLTAHLPTESAAAIVHNDYRIGNVVLAPDGTGRVAAVLDWELAAIGDPLLDVGYFLASVPEPGVPRTPTQDMGTALLEEGYPSRAELAARYVCRSGRELPDLAWYTTFALWRLAALYEYGRRRAEKGVGDPYYREPGLVRSFLTAASRAAGLG